MKNAKKTNEQDARRNARRESDRAERALAIELLGWAPENGTAADRYIGTTRELLESVAAREVIS